MKKKKKAAPKTEPLPDVRDLLAEVRILLAEQQTIKRELAAINVLLEALSGRPRNAHD